MNGGGPGEWSPRGATTAWDAAMIRVPLIVAAASSRLNEVIRASSPVLKSVPSPKPFPPGPMARGRAMERDLLGDLERIVAVGHLDEAAT